MPEKIISDNSTHAKLLTSLGRVYSSQESESLLQCLVNEVDWQYEYFAFGRHFDVPRLQAWYADPGVFYRYSDNLLESHAWIPLLSSIQQTVEAHTGQQFNSVLVTYYRNGNDYVTWHADDEVELGDAPVIASLSFGASREFQYRHKQTGENHRMTLHDGELLLMQPDFQREWEHAVPCEPDVNSPRVNLTFRKVIMVRE